MNYSKILKSSFLSKRNSNMATVAVIGGVAIGVALGALFATKRGKNVASKVVNLFANLTGKSTKFKTRDELGNLIENVRGHIKQNAEGLLGSENNRKDVSAIHAENVPSNKWKEQKEKTIFPNDPNPKAMYN